MADQDELALRHKSTKWKGTVHADLSTAEGVDRSVARAADVAHAVVFLASPLAKFITGAGLDIGGTIRGIL